MRVIVTGGRAFGERWVDPKAPPARRVERPGWQTEVAHLRRVLDEVAGGGPVTLVQGGALGADRRAREWADHFGHEVITFEADWARHGRIAGPKRNAEMVAAGADLVVAFPGGLGTSSCVGLAVNAGLRLRDERSWRAEGVTRD